MTTQVTINGNDVAFEPSASVADVVVRTLTKPDGTFSDRGVAVAVNREVIPRPAWPATHLREGDRIEIITAVQGG